MKPFQIGKIWGIQMSVRPSAIVGSVLLWALLSAVGALFFDIGSGPAVLGGLIAMLLHWLGESWHQLGHAWAARRTGYPMSGIQLWLVLGASQYPADEPELPGSIHIRRALGGPPASLLLTLIAAAVVLLLRPAGGLPYLVALFFMLDNLLVFTLGALLPLSFTDGGTLLYWWGKK